MTHRNTLTNGASRITDGRRARVRYSVLFRVVTLGVVLVAAATAHAETTDVTLQFDKERLDLDTGEIVESLDLPSPGESDAWDLGVARNSNRDAKAVILQNRSNEVEIAHLPGRTFAEVTSDDIEAASFTTEPVDESFGAGLVILVRTDTGLVFKLGNAAETADGVTFDHAQL